jgi:methylated-DNA-[protein]-cysteine S-methyltransferase
MSTYESPIGTLQLHASAAGLTWCHVRRPGPAVRLDDPAGRRWIELARPELDEYFAGTRTTFTVPVDLGVDGVDARVLTALPSHGVTTTYGGLARTLGDVDAQRVGAALAGNPVLVVVPCHRVIGANGKLTGYAAGLRNKRRLLDLEAGQPSLVLA